MTTPYDDPFAGSNKFPSLSWKDAPDGYTVDMVVKSHPKLVQSRDYETGEPAVWPDSGNPKMSIVIEVEVDGEMRSVWAAAPSALFQALKDAQVQAGQRIEPGGRLRITKTHEVPNAKNPRLNPAKQFRAVYAPNDPFAGAPEWAQPQQPAAAPPRTSETYMAPPAGLPMPPPNPLAPYPPAPPATAAAAAVDGGVDPAVLAALKNLNPELLAQMAKQAGQS